MTEFDGRKQRRALTAAEQSLRALGAGSAAQARSSAAKAAELDQTGLYRDLAATVEPLAAHIESGSDIDDAGWDTLVAALGMGPLASLVDELRR
jgi:uncharacterized membrane-anchored protein